MQPQPSPVFPPTAPTSTMRRASSQKECQVNAAWSDQRETKIAQQKKAKSDSGLKFQGVGDLLSSLHTQQFCGQLDPASFDHSLKYDEWIRLPSGRKSENSKRVIIPTPAAMYQTENSTILDTQSRRYAGGSCDTTVTSSESLDSAGRKRSRHEISVGQKEAGVFNRRPTGFGARSTTSALMSSDFASLRLQNKKAPFPKGPMR